MKPRFPAALLAIAAVAPCAAAPVAPTPDGVAQSVRRLGARAEVAALVRADQWELVLDRISAGHPAWIALAPALAPGADAATSESLSVALADALPINAPAVLAVIDDHPGAPPSLSSARVCGAPFIEPEDGMVEDYGATAGRALAGVVDPRLEPVRTTCARILQQAAPR